jgi:hypothetical protein
MARHRSSKVYSSRARRFAIAAGGAACNFPAQEIRETMVRAEGLEPSRAFGSTDFLTVHGFRRPDAHALQRCHVGLRSGLSLHPPPKFGA